MSFTGVALSFGNVTDNAGAAVEAERLGYKSCWIPEVSGPDAVTLMAAAALKTSRLTIATGIISIYLRSPFLTAMTFQDIAEVSSGRVIAGFGTSTPAIVTGWNGMPFGRPIPDTREFVALFRRFVAGERVKSDGMFKVRGASLRGPSPHPIPVYLGALNDRMLELAGEIADGVILNFPTKTYVAHALEVLHRGLAKAGRSREQLTILGNFRCAAGDFNAHANVMRRELITYFTAAVYQKVWTADGYGDEIRRIGDLWNGGDRAGAMSGIADDFVDDHTVFCPTPAAVHAKVQSFLDLGLDGAVLFPVVTDGPERTKRVLAAMAELA
jgi:alkanesulfonate monooxygenase SsuD/methylene tetrahydromethanopterin reductase-like flavin-dependent oxidoreductase (luciferase family)